MYNLEYLIQTYGNEVLRIAYLYTKDKMLSEDIFQEVFLKINNKINSFKGESNIKTWITRITINTSKDYIKSAWNRHVIVMDELIESRSIYHEDTNKTEDAIYIRTVINNLPIKFKDIIICIYYQELTIKETAMVLKIPVGTAKSRLARAKNMLKISLQEVNVDEIK